MSKIHIAVISLLLGFATAFGALAVARTVHLGQVSTATAGGQVTARGAWMAKRERMLARADVELRKALAKHPPKLPKVPHFAPVSAPAPAAAPASAPVVAPSAAPAPAVHYVRPAPIVVIKHRHHGDDGGETNDGGDGGDD